MKPELKRFADRAAAEGLLDVAYATVDSPFGPLVAAKTRRGLVKVSFPSVYDAEETLAELADRISPRVLEAPAELDDVRRQLDLYFAGNLREFDLPLDWRLTDGFRKRAQQAIARIPYGWTRNYTEIARSAGNERAVRAAGTACGSNPIPIVVPCHRVLRSGGGLGGYGGGLPMKEALLEMEGVLP
jgi:methylated-DNA-[protein]-cysteine S-methyltransferase